jgi:hypothetical protein
VTSKIGSEPQTREVCSQDRKKKVGSDIAEQEMNMIKKRLKALGYMD